MKILHVINSLHTGGAEKLIVDTLPRYRSEGLAVDLLILDGTDTLFYQKLRESFNGQIYVSRVGSVYSPLHILSLRKQLEKFDIIHVHLFPSLYWVALCKFLFNFKAKLIFTEHSTSNRRFRKKSTRLIDAFIYKTYSKIIGITETITDFVGERFDIVKNTIVIENGVDLGKIEDGKTYTDQELQELLAEDVRTKSYILQVSSFQHPKDQKTVIGSLVYLADNVSLVLVGAGVLLEETKSYVVEAGLDNRVHFLGSRSDIPSLLKSVDIVVLSSKYEGMSLSSIEGMASGKPFLASNVPGLKEIVEGAGVLFPCGDAEKLAEEINDLLSDRARYSEVVIACQKRASQYDISIMVNKHIALYKEMYENY
jgi:glycosyltransferase involved in cell wall biosynthesis